MASSSSTIPVSPSPQPATGEGSWIPVAASTTSTEAVVDTSAVRSSAPGEATLVAPSSFSDETDDLREGFVFPLVDPWYESSPLFPPRSLDFPFLVEDWSLSCGRLGLDSDGVRGRGGPSLELSAEEEGIAAALRRQSSTRLSDKVAAWGKFSDLPQEFLDCFPDFRGNLPLVYRWVGLKTHDHDLVATFDHEENVLFRSYADDYPDFACVSIFSRFYQPTPLIHYLRVDDYRGLSYLSTVSPGVPVGPQETATYVPDLAPFIKSRAFARWKDEISRIMVPSGHRFGFNTSSMNAYWQRLTQSMVEFVNAGRGDKAPLSIHRWRSSVNVVEDRLIMPSKRGKGGKRDAPVDQAVEKAPKKLASSSKKTPPKKTKARKKGKSTTLVSASEEKSTTAPKEKLIESTVTPFEAKSVGASLSTKKPNKKSVASRPPKGQKKASVTSSPLDEEQPSAASTLPPSKKKKFTAPLFPLGAASRTRSKSGSKATHGPGRSSSGVVIVEDSDMAVDDIVTSSLGGDDLQTVAVNQDKDLGTSPLPEEQMMSVGSTAGDDNMPGADDSNIRSADLMVDDLAIIPPASHLFEHEHDGDGAADLDTVPLSISVPQTVFISRVTGSDAPTAYVMEGISLFGAIPRLNAVSAGGFVISVSCLSGEAPLIVGPRIAGEVPMPEGVHAQGFIESESAVDLGVVPGTGGNVDSAVDRGTQVEGTSASMADVPADSEHLDNIGTGEAMCLPEEDENMRITGEVTVASPPPGPTAVVDSNIGVGSMSREVADFFKEFDKRTPNPYPEWHFWKFNRPLVSYGDFWVSSDSVPYMRQLTTRHGDFIAKFKLGARLGGPMLSLLSSVLAAMSKSDLGSVTKVQILAWRSMVQDLMEVGFDIGFMLGFSGCAKSLSRGDSVYGSDSSRVRAQQITL
uniref:Aminotransferase-like plant mobile domain-containing protein n=1 Tax=Fagus sylvatica TaxID=28930 RepID=A0A2N9HX07_FAGSY